MRIGSCFSCCAGNGGFGEEAPLLVPKEQLQPRAGSTHQHSYAAVSVPLDEAPTSSPDNQVIKTHTIPPQCTIVSLEFFDHSSIHATAYSMRLQLGNRNEQVRVYAMMALPQGAPFPTASFHENLCGALRKLQTSDTRGSGRMSEQLASQCFAELISNYKPSASLTVALFIGQSLWVCSTEGAAALWTLGDKKVQHRMLVKSDRRIQPLPPTDPLMLSAAPIRENLLSPFCRGSFDKAPYLCTGIDYQGATSFYLLTPGIADRLPMEELTKRLNEGDSLKEIMRRIGAQAGRTTQPLALLRAYF